MFRSAPMRWRISMRYLWSHKRQTFICVAGVMISVLMFLSMFSMMEGFRDKFIIETVESSGHIIVNDEPRQTSTPIMQMAYRDRNALLILDRSKPREQVKQIKNPTGLIRTLRSMPGVTAAAPEVTGEAIATFGTKTATVGILGVEPEQ